ncbi:MAG: metallophosphoesterase [Candidatus Coatesbacteria bacterium]|nr:MAG: metallophosphoesterase [Candidatus Coatesbacteria bacterium]
MRRTTLLFLTLVLVVLARADGFTFVILGDRTGGHVEGIHGQVVEKSLAEDADFYVTVGDQIEGYTGDADAVNAEWDEYFSIVETVPTDLYVLPANHDIWDDQSEEIWRDRLGTEPNYSFDYDGVHFVILDTSRWEASDSLPEEYYEWLETDLAAHEDDRLVFVFYHKPLWYNTLADGEPDQLHDLFIEYGVDGVFNGHFHTYGAATYDGIAYTMVGSSGGRMYDDILYKGHFYHYCVVNVKDDTFEVTVVPLEGDERYDWEVVRVSDLRFFDKVEEEYIVQGELYAGDGATGGEGELSVELTNIAAEPFTTEITWDTGETSWVVEPATAAVEVPVNGTAGFSFEAAYDELYPLPEVHLEYPYGDGKAYDYESAARVTRTIEISPVDGKPDVNGNVSASEWTGSAVVDYFCAPDGGAVTIEDTVFHFGYDEENLYVAAVCYQMDTNLLEINATERDGAVWQDDCVGFFFAPAGTDGDIYQIYFNPNGVIFDQRIFENEYGDLDGDVEWNVECDVATRIIPISVATAEPRYWSIEIAIPFDALGTETLEPGDEWRLNFRRKERVLDSSADWQYPITYYAEYFGRAVFVE